MHKTQRLILLLIAAVSLSLHAPPAEARIPRNERIKMTGIKSFDKVFKQARKTDKRIRAAKKNMGRARRDLAKSLQLGNQATYAEALQELYRRAGGKLRVVTRGGKLKLEASEFVPRNIQASIDAVNRMTVSVPDAVRDMDGAAKSARQLVKKAKKFPKNIKKELMSKGVGELVALVKKTPRISRKLVRNMKLVSKMPGRAAGVSHELAQMANAVRSTFE